MGTFQGLYLQLIIVLFLQFREGKSNCDTLDDENLTQNEAGRIGKFSLLTQSFLWPRTTCLATHDEQFRPSALYL